MTIHERMELPLVPENALIIHLFAAAIVKLQSFFCHYDSLVVTKILNTLRVRFFYEKPCIRSDVALFEGCLAVKWGDWKNY